MHNAGAGQIDFPPVVLTSRTVILVYHPLKSPEIPGNVRVQRIPVLAGDRLQCPPKLIRAGAVLRRRAGKLSDLMLVHILAKITHYPLRCRGGTVSLWSLIHHRYIGNPDISRLISLNILQKLKHIYKGLRMGGQLGGAEFLNRQPDIFRSKRNRTPLFTARRRIGKRQFEAVLRKLPHQYIVTDTGASGAISAGKRLPPKPLGDRVAQFADQSLKRLLRQGHLRIPAVEVVGNQAVRGSVLKAHHRLIGPMSKKGSPRRCRPRGYPLLHPPEIRPPHMLRKILRTPLPESRIRRQQIFQRQDFGISCRPACKR